MHCQVIFIACLEEFVWVELWFFILHLLFLLSSPLPVGFVFLCLLLCSFGCLGLELSFLLLPLKFL